MSTPAAIGVYKVSGAEPPAHVAERPWKGVYVHWDGYPEATGAFLLEAIKDLGGDLGEVRKKYVEGVPAWSSLVQQEPGTEDLPAVDDQRTDAVCYCYVLDEEARRLDLYATQLEGRGRRLGSVRFDAFGNASPRYLDLIPEELVADVEPAVAETPLAPEELLELLRPHFPIVHGANQIRLVACPVTSEGIHVLMHEEQYEGERLTSILEAEQLVVPETCRCQQVRVAQFVSAWAEVLRAQIQNVGLPGGAVFRLFSPCALARAKASTQEVMRKVLETKAYLGGIVDLC